MHASMGRAVIVAVLSISAVLASGCAYRPADMVGAGQVSLEKVDAPGVHVMWAEVRLEGDYAVITGSLMPKGVPVRRHFGHVEVEFVDQQGNVVERARSEKIYVLLRGPGRGPGLKRFTVRAKTAVPVGGKVRVAYITG